MAKILATTATPGSLSTRATRCWRDCSPETTIGMAGWLLPLASIPHVAELALDKCWTNAAD
jgi:hypothetical protein